MNHNSTTTTRYETPVAVTTNLAGVLSAGAVNQTFRLAAGTFRLGAACVPKDGQRILGAVGGGTILSGAKLVTGWTFDAANSRWYADGQTQQFSVDSPPDCDLFNGSAYTGCAYYEQFYYDNAWLFRAESLATGATGRYFLDLAADRVYVWDDPNGHVVEAAVTTQAFQGFAGTEDNVEIRNMVIEKFVGPVGLAYERGAIKCGGNWIVADNEIRLNRGIGVTASSGSQVLDNNIHHNGQYGINGSGDVILIQDNLIDYNNQAWYNSDWNAGGTKITNATNVTFSGNTVRNNRGPGLWCDGDCIYVEYAYNIIEDNHGVGLFHEVSFDAEIHNNTLRRNNLLYTGYSLAGAADLLIGTSGSLDNTGEVYVHHNTVETYTNGIDVKDNTRVKPGDTYAYRKFRVKNVRIEDNTVSFINNSGLSTPLFAAGFIIDRVTRTITNKQILSNEAILTTSVAHRFVVGDVLLIEGVDATFNGTYTISHVPTSTTFKYAKTAANVASQAATGTAIDTPESVGEVTWNRNTYNVPTSGGSYWKDTDNVSKTWTQWQAAPLNNDPQGTRNVVP